MKLFLCNRSVDNPAAKSIAEEMEALSGGTAAVLRETEHSEKWQAKVKEKLFEVDFVIFLLGDKTFESKAVRWEYEQASQLNKRLIGIRLAKTCSETLSHWEGQRAFANADQCYQYLESVYPEERALLIEQYKIMVGSTEKVTDQRLRVNNLFFTVISSILSLSIVAGKIFGFNEYGTAAMLALSVMAFLLTLFWEKLVGSYGNLNRGKFHVIDGIERRLMTNMFEYEWHVLQDRIKYESNTDTEKDIVRSYRWLIGILAIAEFGYLIHVVKPFTNG